MTPEQAHLILSWERNGLPLYTIGEYCAVMNLNDPQAVCREFTTTFIELGQKQIAEAKRVLGVITEG